MGSRVEQNKQNKTKHEQHAKTHKTQILSRAFLAAINGS